MSSVFLRERITGLSHKFRSSLSTSALDGLLRTGKCAAVAVFCMAILLPQEYSFGFITLAGKVIIRSLGIAAYLAVAYLLLDMLRLNLRQSRWLWLLLAWISFVQASRSTPPPLIGQILSFPLRRLVGQGDILIGVIMLLTAVRLLDDTPDSARPETHTPSRSNGETKSHPDTSMTSVQKDTVSALVNLGFSIKEAEQAVKGVDVVNGSDVAALIRKSLKILRPSLTTHYPIIAEREHPSGDYQHL